MSSAGFLLDTNVLSELMRDGPAPAVLQWFAGQTAPLLHTSTVTQAEMLAGIAVLPAGKRRDALAQAAQQIFNKDFLGRCLAFDSAAAEHYALVRAQRKHAGKPINTEDAQIAAIALAARMKLVTRNTKDFTHVDGLTLIDPWQAH